MKNFEREAYNKRTTQYGQTNTNLRFDSFGERTNKQSLF